MKIHTAQFLHNFCLSEKPTFDTFVLFLPEAVKRKERNKKTRKRKSNIKRKRNKEQRKKRIIYILYIII